jgi:glycine/D-amino acid oxidase-like deaminating enzyme/nitrite reductase/ring-hydroxylating ferredoxin subunit
MNIADYAGGEMSVQVTVEKPEQRTLPGKSESFWIDTASETRFPPLQNELFVDVAILGGGIAGLTAAVLLREAGRTGAVIVADRVVRRVSGRTTAKITSAHGIVYRHLLTQFGKEGALLYAQANQSAIERVASFIQQRNIFCDFKRTSAYTFVESGSVDELRDEYEAADSLGLPVTYTEDVPLPFRVRAAMRFSAQAQFHPRKYLLSLLRSIPGKDSYIFENTRATAVAEGEPCLVTTDMGTIKAQNIIVATHYPFVNDGGYLMKMTPKQSYVMGFIVKGKVPDGMFYSPGQPYSTIRSHPYLSGELLLVGGEDNATGRGGDIVERYRKVEEYARSRFDVQSVEYHWTTQDNVTMDAMPYVGRLSDQHEKIFVATGFGGWGMTGGTVAAMILSDRIIGRPNPWSALYDSLRGTPKTPASPFFAMNADVAKEFTSGYLKKPVERLEDIANGEGAVIERDHEKVGVYRDHQGKIHAVSAVCTHMGCTLAWDNAEKSWDCPCHGSRFNFNGQVVYGPATRNLEQKDMK